MKGSHDGCSFVRVGKTKRVAELVYQGLRLDSCLKLVFININLSLIFVFNVFFYLKHVRASVCAQSPFLCVVHVNIAAPPAQRKHFTKI